MSKIKFKNGVSYLPIKSNFYEVSLDYSKNMKLSFSVFY